MLEIITKDSSQYNAARAVVNMDHEGMPDAILFCENDDDVVKAVKKSKQDGKTVRVRSGRHSYEGFSSGNKGVYIIDVSRIKGVKLSDDKQTAKIGAGGQLYSDVYLPLWEDGRVVIPAGSCPTVGLAGLTAGGGFSFSGRHLGLTCDSVLAFTIVTADGALLTVDPKGEYADLFWACCGAGCGNFGIITSFTFKVYPAADVSIFRIEFSFENQVAGVAKAWEKLIRDSSDQLMGFLSFATVKKLSVFGQYYGSQKALEQIVNQAFFGFKIISKAFNTFSNIDAIRYWGGVHDEMQKKPLEGNVEPHHYPHFIPSIKIDSGTNLSNSHANAASEHGEQFGDIKFPESTFKASSIMLDRFFNDQELSFIEEQFSNKNFARGFVVLDSQFNGVSSKLPDDTNAYAHRKSFASVQIYKTWKEPEYRQASIDWVRTLRAGLSQAGKGAYCNYPDDLIENYGFAYYGDHYEKLRALKKKYDPENLFNYSQSIPVE